MAEVFVGYWNYQGDKDKHCPDGGEGQEGETDIK